MVYTSASSSHPLGPEHQAACLNSWVDHGYTIHTVNSTAENAVPPSKAIQLWVDRDAAPLYGKSYVFLDDIFKAGKEAEYMVITNSDIELRDPDNILRRSIAKAEEGLVLAHRIDHAGTYSGKPYEQGIDLFVIHRKFIHLLGPSLFCIGQTWWDYWIPYRFIKNRIPIHRIREPIIYHHSHQMQHNGHQWARMTQHFTWLENVLHGKPPQYVTGHIFNEIRKHER